MILGSRSNNFWFTFGKGFIPEKVVNKYQEYVFRHFSPYDNVENFVMSSMQSMTFPNLTHDPVSQTRRFGKRQEYKNSVPIADQFSKSISITFRAYEGYINYFILLDTMLHYLNFLNEELYFDDFQLRLLDGEGRDVMQCKFLKPYFLGMTEVSLSYSDNNPDLTTFSMDFGYNILDILPERD